MVHCQDMNVTVKGGSEVITKIRLKVVNSNMIIDLHIYDKLT